MKMITKEESIRRFGLYEADRTMVAFNTAVDEAEKEIAELQEECTMWECHAHDLEKRIKMGIDYLSNRNNS